MAASTTASADTHHAGGRRAYAPAAPAPIRHSARATRAARMEMSPRGIGLSGPSARAPTMSLSASPNI